MVPVMEALLTRPQIRGLDEESRGRLAKLCVRLLKLWGLDRRQQAIMLGLSPDTRSTLARFEQGAPLPNQRDILDRAGHLMGILDALEILFPDNPELVDAWATTRDAALDGATPFEIVDREGVAGLRDLRAYLEYLKGR